MNTLALSIRQPWAHLIIHCGKDIENRDWATSKRGKVLIHAGKRMTLEDYTACVIFCSGLPDGVLAPDFVFPAFEELKSQCGGIVGETNIVDCVKTSPSPWFCGEFGFVLEESRSLPFQPCNGQLGFFVPKIARTEVAA